MTMAPDRERTEQAEIFMAEEQQSRQLPTIDDIAVAGGIKITHLQAEVLENILSTGGREFSTKDVISGIEGALAAKRGRFTAIIDKIRESDISAILDVEGDGNQRRYKINTDELTKVKGASEAQPPEVVQLVEVEDPAPKKPRRRGSGDSFAPYRHDIEPHPANSTNSEISKYVKGIVLGKGKIEKIPDEYFDEHPEAVRFGLKMALNNNKYYNDPNASERFHKIAARLKRANPKR